MDPTESTRNQSRSKSMGTKTRREQSLESLFRALLLIVSLIMITDLVIYWVLEHEGSPMDLKRNEGLPQHVLDIRMFTQEIDHYMKKSENGDKSPKLEKGKIWKGKVKNQDSKERTGKVKANTRADSATIQQSSKTKTKDNDKSRIIDILKSSEVEVSPDDIEKLPTWGEVTELYGSEPKILGLDTCAEFRETVPAKDMYIAPAGIFNTGTNLLANNLAQFCRLPEREAVTKHDKKPGHGRKWKAGTMFQVPWGKHSPAELRGKHKAELGSFDVIQDHVLPVVIIKDPYHWMVSMCRHSYVANWYHTKNHCPNLIPNKFDFGHRGITPNSGPVNVNVRYTDDRITHHKGGLVGLWNDWYSAYLKAGDEFPRLMIRYEDLLFHQKTVMKNICDCAGGELKNEHKMHIRDTSAKGNSGVHTGSNGLLSAITRYGRSVERLGGMTIDDRKYAERALNPELMELFAYTYPSIDDDIDDGHQ